MSNPVVGRSASVTLWCSYVGRGAPSNAAGSHVGYGLTKEQAIKAAAHWNNQAPYAKYRRVTIFDQLSLHAVQLADTEAFLSIVPDLSSPEYEFSTPSQRKLSAEAWRLARDGKTASAILLYLAGEANPSREVVS